jgi:hypothetical protein
MAAAPRLREALTRLAVRAVTAPLRLSWQMDVTVTVNAEVLAADRLRDRPHHRSGRERQTRWYLKNPTTPDPAATAARKGSGTSGRSTRSPN